jgi:protocatechuate 3,4-dioxygenase beta subunit
MHHDDFGGLHEDLRLTGAAMKRRDLIRLAVSATLLPLIGCSDSATGTDEGDCERIPQETAGPFPGDGSNGPNVLTQTGVVRSDVRPSFGTLTGTADGIPLTIRLTLVSTSNDCEPLAGYAVYLWHCDRLGRYSLYSTGVTDQNYLRGVQQTDANGQVTFSSIFPACYPGRWPHIHFEIYPSLTAATSAANTVATSQLALPEDVCDDVYATTDYAQSVINLQQVSLAADNVFGDGAALELAEVSGSVSAGYTAELTIAI